MNKKDLLEKALDNVLLGKEVPHFILDELSEDLQSAMALSLMTKKIPDKSIRTIVDFVYSEQDLKGATIFEYGTLREIPSILDWSFFYSYLDVLKLLEINDASRAIKNVTIAVSDMVERYELFSGRSEKDTNYFRETVASICSLIAQFENPTRSTILESLIKESPSYARIYSETVLKQRWEDAEKIIFTDPTEAIKYCMFHFENRCPWVEDIINLEKLHYSVGIEYCNSRIIGRWKEFENALLTNKDIISIHQYCQDVIKNAWPEFEKVAIKLNFRGYCGFELYLFLDYAARFMHSRWLEVEGKIEAEFENRKLSSLPEFEKEFHVFWEFLASSGYVRIISSWTWFHENIKLLGDEKEFNERLAIFNDANGGTQIPIDRRPANSADSSKALPISIPNYMKTFSDFAGMEEVKSQIDKIVKRMLHDKMVAARSNKSVSSSNHILFLGNPGTGKTEIARKLGDILYELGVTKRRNIVEVSRSDLTGHYVNETSKITKRKIEEAIGGILFIDEAYSLAPINSNDWGPNEVINELVAGMENYRDNLIVIAAGYEKEMLKFLETNRGLKDRFRHKIYFQDYSPEELLNIIHLMIENEGYTLSEAAKEPLLRLINEDYRNRDENFGNARAIRNRFDEIKDAIANRIFDKNDYDPMHISADDVPSPKGVYSGSNLETELRKVDALVGLENVKSEIRKLVNLAKLNQAKMDNGQNIEPVNLHCAFVGNPGTGKTIVARLLGKIYASLGLLSRGHTVEVSRADLIGEWIGWTAPKTLAKVKEAIGGVLFIDEAYSLVNDASNDFGWEAISTIIKAMEDNRGNLVVVFAGYKNETEKLLNSNLGLKSRLSSIIEFEDYDIEQLEEIGYNLLTQQGYEVPSEVRNKMRVIINESMRNLELENSTFGNARAVRQYVEKAIVNVAARFVETGDFENSKKVVIADLPKQFISVSKKNKIGF